MKHIFSNLLCLFVCLCPLSLHAQWQQTGADIDDKTGYAVSYSSDGTKIAIGSPNSAGGGLNRGHVSIYQNINGQWAQIGQNIDGESDFDQSGWTVALSADGKKVAIGSIFNQENSGRGQVRIFQLKEDSWQKIGEDIDGEDDGDNSGFSLSLSADGRRVAIGAPKNAGGGSRRGHVRVFQFDDSLWSQLGEDLDGETDNDNAGSNVMSCRAMVFRNQRINSLTGFWKRRRRCAVSASSRNAAR